MKQFNLISYAMAGAMSLLTLGSTAGASEGHDDMAITVFKTPWCGCCQVWVDAMKNAGYKVETNDLDDLSNIKQQAEVPKNLEACHTSVIGGERKYVLEGHVPITAVKKLQAEKPKIRGISTPGMPTGSLGMGYDENAKYPVYGYLSRSDEKPTIFYEAGKRE